MELVTDLLEARGHDVVQATTAEEGIQAAKRLAPNIILADIALPGMDGLTATAILKNDPKTTAIPVVALTAHAMHGDAEKAIAAGCVGYITKPINTREFVDTVEKYLK
jgi:CheY-like chemotaxis protein